MSPLSLSLAAHNDLGCFEEAILEAEHIRVMQSVSCSYQPNCAGTCLVTLFICEQQLTHTSNGGPELRSLSMSIDMLSCQCQDSKLTSMSVSTLDA